MRKTPNKLKLKTETVRQLTQQELGQAVGGWGARIDYTAWLSCGGTCRCSGTGWD